MLPPIHEHFTEDQLQIIWRTLVNEIKKREREHPEFKYYEIPDMDLETEAYNLQDDNSTIDRKFKPMGEIHCKDRDCKGLDGQDLDVQIFFFVRIPNFDPHLPDSRKKYGFMMSMKRMMQDLESCLWVDMFNTRWTVHTGQGDGWRYNVIFQTKNTNGEEFDVEWEIHIVQ